MEPLNYYEFLQISPNAQPSTIHRVYRFLAGRLHPDVPGTGDAETFLRLKEAYDVLSDPDRRAQYDATCKEDAPSVVPLSKSIDFMDSLDGELNRRLAVLALLYVKRRINPYCPEVSLNEVEVRMGFPRDYLQFTMWYLRSKNYISMADNSDFTLTALGVDFVETNRQHVPVLNKLLTSGPATTTPDGATDAQGQEAGQIPFGGTMGEGSSSGTSGSGEFASGRGDNDRAPAELPVGTEQVPVGASV